MCDSVPCPLQRAVQSHFLDFPICSDSEESACQAGGRVSIWVEKIPWRKEWLPIIVFLPGEFHQQRSLAGHCPWGCKELDATEQLTLFFKLGNWFVQSNKDISLWSGIVSQSSFKIITHKFELFQWISFVSIPYPPISVITGKIAASFHKGFLYARDRNCANKHI